MLFFIILITFVLLLVIILNAKKCDDKYWELSYEEKEPYKKKILYKIYNNEWLCASLIVTIIVLGIISFFMLIVLCFTHIDSAANGAKLAARQEALEYKVSSDYAKDELGLRNKDLIDEIQIWNEMIASRKQSEGSIWIGIFYSKIIEKYSLHKINFY